MRSAKIIKLAASTLVLGTVAVAGFATLQASQSADATKNSDVSDSGRSAAAQAQKALAANKAVDAVHSAERAVAASPNNADYRFLLGDSYLAAGRFSSAEAAYSDTMKLSPAHDRASLKLALAKIALGKGQEAIGVLNENKANIAVADFGLALALAGDPTSAVAALEPAARAFGATAKTRQNLALAYAIGGRWAESRAVAAQDLPVDAVDRRMTEWAAFVHPATSYDQIASLLHVTPVFDAGQPAALALADTPTRSAAPVAVASNDVVTQVNPVEPQPAAPTVAQAAAPYSEPEASAAPVETAAVEAAPVAEPAASAASVSTPKPEAAKPLRLTKRAALQQPKPNKRVPLIKSSPVPVKQAVVSTKVPVKPAPVKPAQFTKSGNFAVQLGAYSNAARADAAWSNARKNAAVLGQYRSSKSKVNVDKGSLYRLAVSGFTSREDANRVCAKVRASGGNCFVRSMIGDTNIRYAKRGNGTRLAAVHHRNKKSVKIASR